MENTDNWKQRYFESLEKLEKLEFKTKSWEELENVLRMAMSRVAVATQGLDPALDQHLHSLRHAVYAGDYPDLEIIIENISTTVKHLDEQSRRHQLSTAPQLLTNLISRLRLPSNKKQRLNALHKTIDALDDSGPFDEVLQQLAELINETLSANTVDDGYADAGGLSGWLKNPAPQSSDSEEGETDNNGDTASTLAQQLNHLLQSLPAGGLRDDLVNRFNNAGNLTELAQCLAAMANDLNQSANSTEMDPASWDLPLVESNAAAAANPMRYRNIAWGDGEQQVITTFCLRLLEALDFPHEYYERVEALREVITEGFNMLETGGIIQKMADLITATRLKVEKEKQELQDFLAHLTDHLIDVDSQLSGAENHRRANIEVSKLLNDAVQKQVSIIDTSINDATDLSQLKANIQERLLAIRDHFEQHRQLEEQQQKELKLALAESNSRLQVLEQESQQLRQRLSQEHQQAIHDSLTGMYNRLAYEERMEQEYARWKRYQHPLAVMIFDIDHFKKINDTYGHKAGDKALKLIANTLQRNLRESDFVARYGGEEFVVLMPHTSLDDAIGAANKLREAVFDCQFQYQQEQINISVSCGATQFIIDDTIDSAFQRADQALFNAKQLGRNHCEAVE
jgi:diguanylate cyclase